jgi:hypothetical protein
LFGVEQLAAARLNPVVVTAMDQAK